MPKASDIVEGECVLISGVPVVPISVERSDEDVTLHFSNRDQISLPRDADVAIPGDDFAA